MSEPHLFSVERFSTRDERQYLVALYRYVAGNAVELGRSSHGMVDRPRVSVLQRVTETRKKTHRRHTDIRARSNNWLPSF